MLEFAMLVVFKTRNLIGHQRGSLEVCQWSSVFEQAQFHWTLVTPAVVVSGTQEVRFVGVGY